jgi:hypothetical protein
MSDLGENEAGQHGDAASAAGETAATAVDQYMVSMEGPGLSLQRSVGSGVALQVVALVMSPGQVEAAQPTGPTSTPFTRAMIVPPATAAPGAGTPRRAVGEYVRSTGATRYADKIVAIGAWLEDQQGKHSFTRDAGTRQSRESRLWPAVS